MVVATLLARCARVGRPVACAKAPSCGKSQCSKRTFGNVWNVTSLQYGSASIGAAGGQIRRTAMHGRVRPGNWGERHIRRYRTLFLSDVHLGTPACRASALLNFLEHNDADTIYLVGDIVDFWRIKRFAIWPQAHSDVLQEFLRKARGGTRIVLVPGNHDEGLRDYCGTHLNGIEIVRDCLHTTADGRRLLVIHGDEFDMAVRYAKWLALLGNHGQRL